VKYATEGGNIRIWVYKSSEGAKFEIENTSPPLPTDAMEKIFDSFYRVDASRTEPGTGLGLAIVKTITQLHRGKCAVRNKRYKDETCVEFSVTLPLT
jgi:signal transduction histidine kinase